PLSKTSRDALERHALPEKPTMKLPKSALKRGLQSDDPPSKLGLESVRLSKIEQEELRSASKFGSGCVDSPPKDGLESFKSLPKSDPVAHGDSTHIISPEMHVTLSIYDRTGAYQRSCIIEVDRDATILELIHRVHQQTGVPLDQMKLFHDGSLVQDLWNDQDRLSACNINEKAIMTVVVRDPVDSQIYLPVTPNSTTNVEAKDEVQATSDDYDEDLYIVDPQAHFDMLRQLERNVLQRSEYYQTKRKYSLSSSLDPVDEKCFFSHEWGLQPSLRQKIRGSSIVTRTIQKKDPSSTAFWHLLKSYSIILNASRSLEQMVNLHFCKSSINILVFHERPEVIEVRRVPSAMILDIERDLEAALSFVLEADLEERSFALTLTNMVMPPCRRLLERVGSYVSPAPTSHNLSELTITVRGLALLIDVGLVSYVRSHGSGFDGSYFSGDLRKLEVNLGDKLIFGCDWAKLACLHSFLDTREVWVFDFSGIDNSSWRRRLRRHSLCARMEDIADIWGPVYTVPTGTGKVKYYGVSKGVIYRVKSNKESPIPGAKLCHYSSRSSFVRKETSRLLANMDELALSQDDLLLIGAGFCENASCNYTMSAFTKENASAMTVLGTKDSAWKWDSRGLTVGLSKYMGVTMSGTQKLMPQTTLKQHVLDKWTTMPSQSNPAVLNQYLGVEISHCTGDARRISLKTLMISKPIRPILERQVPDWHRKPWGEALNKALHSSKREDIVNVWKEHASNRNDIADLVCCALQVLDTTGWNEQEVFNSAVLIDNEEWVVPVPSNLNSWVVALKDTHLTSAYVITNEICFGWVVPDRTISTCNTFQTFTALQTQIVTTKEYPSDSKAEYLLKPSGERFRRTECGSPTIFLLSPKTRIFPRISLRTKPYECSELLNDMKPGRFKNTVYLRASIRSYRGRYEVKNTIVARRKFSLRQYRNGPDHDGSMGTDEPNSQSEEITDQHVGLQRPRQGRTQGLMSLTQTPLAKHETGVATFMAQKATHPVVHARNKPEQASLRDEFLSRCTQIHARASALWPTSTSMPESKEVQELIYSDVHGQDTYNFNSHQAKSRIRRKSIGCSDVRSSCPVTPEATRNGLDTTLHNFADSTIGDENDSDPDSMINSQPQRLPVGTYSLGGSV
ncbi:MAG: hypothetical protein L6R36_009017, partial [Xanthoria steineri]